MGQFDATKGKQALEIRSSLSERRALTDPILPGDSADLAHAHSRQWAKAHGEFSTRDLKHFFKYVISAWKNPYLPMAAQHWRLSQMFTNGKKVLSLHCEGAMISRVRGTPCNSHGASSSICPYNGEASHCYCCKSCFHSVSGGPSSSKYWSQPVSLLTLKCCFFFLFICGTLERSSESIQYFTN